MGTHQLDLPIVRIAPGHDALNAVLSGLGEGVGRRLLPEGHDVGPLPRDLGLAQRVSRVGIPSRVG